MTKRTEFWIAMTFVAVIIVALKALVIWHYSQVDECTCQMAKNMECIPRK